MHSFHFYILEIRTLEFRKYEKRIENQELRQIFIFFFVLPPTDDCRVQPALGAAVVLRVPHSPSTQYDLKMPRRKTPSNSEKDSKESSDKNGQSSEHICRVCGDKASEHIHYGSTVCYSCRAFFRRIAVKGTEPTVCNKISMEVGQCPMTKKMRHLCPFCRFNKCVQVGMKTSWVMTKDEKDEMREKAAIKRLTGIASDVLPPTSYEERRKYVRWGFGLHKRINVTLQM